MLYVDIPTKQEVLFLANKQEEVCVSIYLETSPLLQQIPLARTQFSNSIKEAVNQLKAVHFDKRKLAKLEALLDDLLNDMEFWNYQANSLAVFATPEHIRTYRLANTLTNHVEVAERFYVKPLLRALTFEHAGYILALSENQVRLIEFFADSAPIEIHVDGLPKDASSALGIAAPLNMRVRAAEDKKVQLNEFVRKVDKSLRPVLTAHDYPLILVAAEPLASIYRITNTYENLLPETVHTNPEVLSPLELVTRVRPLLDQYYQSKIQSLHQVFDRRKGERRATTDLLDIARAVTIGAAEYVFVDIDIKLNGTIDEDGKVHISEESNANTYGIIDEIVRRALATGATVLALRQQDIPMQQTIAATLRYPH